MRPCRLDVDDTGNRVVVEAPPITSLKRSWFEAHGMGDMWQPDGTVVLDTAGEYRYRPLRDLPDGSIAYERIED